MGVLPVKRVPYFLLPDPAASLSLEAGDDGLALLPRVDPDSPILVVHVRIPFYFFYIFGHGVSHGGGEGGGEFRDRAFDFASWRACHEV